MNEHRPSREALLSELHSSSKRIRTKAVRALGDTGDIEVVEPLIKALEDHAACVRLQAVKALGRFRDTRGMEPLIARLDDEDPMVRRPTAVALRKYGVELRQPLMDAYRTGSPRLRMASLGILANFRTAAITELLIAALEDDDRRMAQSAAAFLAKRKDKKAAARLIEELQKPGEDRAYFARILGQIGDPAAFEPLQDHLEDECPAVRLAVIEALRKIDNARAIDFFYELLGDPSDPARGPLSRSLAELDLLGAVQSLGRSKRRTSPETLQQALAHVCQHLDSVRPGQPESGTASQGVDTVLCAEDHLRRLESTLRELGREPGPDQSKTSQNSAL